MQILKKHQTPLYIVNRIRQIFFQHQNPEAPWLTRQSIALLDQLIMKTDNGLEFGSGRSTKWLAARCHHLTSVEHDEKWYSLVNKMLIERTNVKYLLRSLNKDNPVLSEYLNPFNDLEDQSIDFVLVDGRIREFVAHLAIQKLKSGGLLIIDNAEYFFPNNYNLSSSIGIKIESIPKEWKEFYNSTIDWRRIWTSDGISATLMFFKV